MTEATLPKNFSLPNRNTFFGIIHFGLQAMAFFPLLYYHAISTAYGTWDHDTGFHLNISYWWANKGLTPIIDYPFYYPPIVYALNNILFYLNIPPLHAVIATPLIWVTINSILSYTLAYRLTHHHANGRWAVIFYLTFSYFYQSNNMTLEHGESAFTLISLIFLCSSTPKHSKYIWAGFFFSLACLSKQTSVFGIILLLLLAHKKTLYLIYGLAIPGILTLTWLSFDFSLINNNFLTPFLSYGSKTSSPDYLFFLNEPDLNSFSCLLIIFLFLKTLYFIILKNKENTLILLSCIIIIIALSTFRAHRNYFHYSLTLWPYILFPLFYGMKGLQEKTRNYILTSLFLIYFSMQYWVPKRNLMNVRRFYYSIVNSHQLKSPLLYYFNPIANFVKEKANKDEKILVLGEEPIINLLSERLDVEMPNIWTKPYQDFNNFGSAVIMINRPVPRVKNNLIIDKLSKRRYELYQTLEYEIYRGIPFTAKIYIKP